MRPQHSNVHHKSYIIADYGKPSPHGLRFIASPRPAALVPADTIVAKEESCQKQSSKRLCRLYVRTRVLVFYTGYHGTWCRYMVTIEELTAKMRLQTHYTMSRDRGRRRRSTRQKDGRVSDPQRSCTRRPQLALLFLLSVSSERAEVVYLLAATILYRAAACCCCCYCDGSRKRQGPRTKKAQNAQGIRHRHISSPPPHHGIARPNAYHADEGRVDTHRLARRSSDAERQ